MFYNETLTHEIKPQTLTHEIKIMKYQNEKLKRKIFF